MKKIGAVTLFVFVILSAAFPANAQEQERIKITYIGFADNLELAGGRLDHSFAQNSPAARSAAMQLTSEQERLFTAWLERCGVFSLAGPDVMVSQPYHPGAEERNSLLVEYGGKKIDLSWTGVSSWKDPARRESLDHAVDELTKLSIRLIREAGLL